MQPPESHLSEKHTTWILDRIRDGNRDAMNELLRRLGPRIEARVRREKGHVLAANAQTEDFSQDIAMELMRYLPRVDLKDSDALERYLYRVIRSSMSDKGRELRAERRNVARNRPLPTDSVLNLDPPAAAGAASPSEAASNREEESWLRLALPLLGAEDEALFIRTKMNHEPYGEVAKTDGSTPDAIRMRVARITAKLVRTIQQLKQGRLRDLVEDDPADESPERGDC